MLAIVLALLACTMGLPHLHAADKGSIQFRIQGVNSEALPCRIHLRDATGTPVKAGNLPFWHDHFVCSGSIQVSVSPGHYRWEIERGPEYSRYSGEATIAIGQQVRVVATLERTAHLKNENWVSGDLHVHRSVSDIKLLMRAEDLHFVPVIGWWNTPAPDATAVDRTEFRFDENRIYTIAAGEDERAGGALLYFGLRQPLDLSVESREFPSPMHFVEQAHRLRPDVWIDVEKPFWWDTPTWLATGTMDSIGIANNHMNRSGMYENEAWGRPRDTERLPNPRGNGFWTQEIYYHILNSGIRIPPSAGSASGVLANPLGYNRVYVHLGNEPFTRDNWFAALSSGRCFVTNGPLLRATVNDSLPGSLLKMDSAPMDVHVAIHLTSNDPVSEVEIIHNGEVIKRMPCRSQIDQQLKATIRLEQPGWMLIRAIAEIDDTFRFASTAPWYIESKDNETFVSRRSARFFLDWVNERIERVNANVPGRSQRDSVLRWHVEARQFWLEKQESASAE